MKLLFMGTPDIAAESLAALIAAGHEICGVFTREDKPVGRKQVLTPPPVKQLALKHGLKVYQPKSLKNDEALALVSSLSPEIIAVVAYGRILPKGILDIPPFGCVNLHVSLLPKYRGSAPVQWAVINGDKQTGVSIMFMDEGVDTGDIISTVSLNIGENETSGELFSRVSSIGAKALCEAVQSIKNGTALRTKQNSKLATLAPMLSKEMALFGFERTSEEIHNLVRGLNPWPMAYFVFEGKKIKVLKAKRQGRDKQPCGTIISTSPLVVACGEGAVELCELVPEGSGPMSGSAWAAGKRFTAGDSL